MSSPLLKTKLLIPPARPELVQRRRLIQALSRGVKGKLTLVSAPAGYGKTTLLSSWATGCGRPVAWLTLDEGDNDPARFLAYFTAAIQTAAGDAEKNSQQISPTPALSEEILIELVNQAATAEERFVLVLDDYHVIRSKSIHETMSFVLEHLPIQMRLVIASRTELPLPVGGLRGKGDLMELRQSDLRFTLDEARDFLNKEMGLGLSAKNIEALSKHTEGWAVGLQMAALSLLATISAEGNLRNGDVTALVKDFSGSHHYVMEYLVEEVLQHQMEEVQDFLTRTSILDQMCGSLCSAVLGMDDGRKESQRMLEHLESSNLFLTALDDRREWFRYHELFAEFLKHRLENNDPDAIPHLHRRAAEWHRQHGSISEAIDHALEAKDYPHAAEMIYQIAETTLGRSEVVTLLNWIEALPEQITLSKPMLCIYHAWTLLLAGEPLQVVEKRLREAGRQNMTESSMEIALHAFMATFQGKISEASALSRQALEQLPEEDKFLRSILSWIIGIDTVWGKDNLGEGIEILENTAEESLKIGNFMVAILTLSNLAELYMMKGKLGRAQEIYQRALTLAVDQTGKRLPIAGMAMSGLGELYRRKNDLESAKITLEESLRLNKSWGEIGMLDGYVSLALVKQAQGDLDGAQTEIGKARNVAQSFDLIELDDLMIDTYQVILWILQGNLEAAREWAKRRGFGEEVKPAARGVGDEGEFLGSTYLSALEQLALMRLWLAEGRNEESLVALEKLWKETEKRSFGWLAIEAQTLKADVYHVLGKTSKALDCLQNALRMTKADRSVRIFLEAGKPMKELLETYVQQPFSPGDLRSYAQQILTAFKTESEMLEQRNIEDIPKIGRLSRREAEVLRLLAEGFSNQEIAEKLVVAASTVKSHVNHIYDKLGVTKRTQAVARARELGLL